MSEYFGLIYVLQYEGEEEGGKEENVVSDYINSAREEKRERETPAITSIGMQSTYFTIYSIAEGERREREEI